MSHPIITYRSRRANAHGPGQSCLASHMASAAHFHYPFPLRPRGCAASSDATHRHRAFSSTGRAHPALHFHSPTRRNSCCVSAARGECPLPLCCHSVTRCGFLEDRPTITESLPHDAPGPALPAWHFSGKLFYESICIYSSPVHSPRHRTASMSSVIQQKHV